jgi:hypothetical protein
MDVAEVLSLEKVHELLIRVHDRLQQFNRMEVALRQADFELETIKQIVGAPETVKPIAAVSGFVRAVKQHPLEVLLEPDKSKNQEDMISLTTKNQKLSWKLELLQAEKRLMLNGVLRVRAPAKHPSIRVLTLIQLATRRLEKFRESGSQWSPGCTLTEIKQTWPKDNEAKKVKRNENQIFNLTISRPGDA